MTLPKISANTSRERTSETVNAAFLGVGNFICGYHLPNIAANPECKVYMLCDLNTERLEEVAKKYNPMKTTTDYHQVLADPKVNLVVIGTRGDMHAALAVEAAEAGKDIVVEKPMTHTIEETSAVVEAVRRNGVRLLVGYNRRFSPAMIRAKEIFHSQSDTRPANIYYRLAQETKGYDEKQYYAFDLNGGGGHLLTEGCHIFDILPWFLEEEPVEIYAAGALETNDHVTIRYSGGSLATILCIARAGLCYPKECMEVFGGYKTLVMQEFVEVQVDNYPGIPNRSFFPVRNDKVTEVAGEIGIDGGIELYMEKRFYLANHNLYWSRPLNCDKGHRHMINAYIDAIQRGDPSPINEVAGARATICALAAMESLRQGRPVKINPSDYFAAGNEH